MKVPERYRWKNPAPGYESSAADGNNGCFVIPYRKRSLKVIASDGNGWDHVSVSLPDRCPTWAEMCHVKAQFFSDDECVIQYHPPASDYVNNHTHCLHLWRPQNKAVPMPPNFLV